jgi:hypothetical protein
VWLSDNNQNKRLGRQQHQIHFPMRILAGFLGFICFFRPSLLDLAEKDRHFVMKSREDKCAELFGSIPCPELKFIFL